MFVLLSKIISQSVASNRKIFTFETERGTVV
jgi:hypothetical protein